VWSVDVGSVECGVWSVKSGGGSAKCEVWNLECVMCEVCVVEC